MAAQSSRRPIQSARIAVLPKSKKWVRNTTTFREYLKLFHQMLRRFYPLFQQLFSSQMKWRIHGKIWQTIQSRLQTAAGNGKMNLSHKPNMCLSMGEILPSGKNALRLCSPIGRTKVCVTANGAAFFGDALRCVTFLLERPECLGCRAARRGSVHPERGKRLKTARTRQRLKNFSDFLKTANFVTFVNASCCMILLYVYTHPPRRRGAHAEKQNGKAHRFSVR